MNRKMGEYVIITIVIFLLIYASYFALTYHYHEERVDFEYISLLSPASSHYTVNGDMIEFRDPIQGIYNLDVSKLTSSDARVTQLLNYFAHFRNYDLEYYNESCYKISGSFDDDNGFSYHMLLIPIDSFDKDSLTFKNESEVILFDGVNREFVIDSVIHSEVEL